MRSELTLLVTLTMSAAVPAGALVIDNGLAPPNANNVIDASDSLGVVDVANAWWGAPTVVELVDGGELITLRVYESSRLLVSGGTVLDRINAYGLSDLSMSGGTALSMSLFDSAALEMVGGTVFTLDASGSPTLTMGGGTVSAQGTLGDSSTLAMSGGTYERLAVFDSVTVTMSGGTVRDELGANNSCRIGMTGGTVQNKLVLYDAAELAMGGGTVGQLLSANGSSKVVMTDGTVENTIRLHGLSTLKMRGGAVWGLLSANESSNVAMTGGSAWNIEAYGSATMTIRGGSVVPEPASVWPEVFAGDASKIQIVGREFAIDGDPAPPGPIAAPSGRLTGTLESGEPIAVQFCHNGCQAFYTGRIELIRPIPEPDATLLFAAALIGLGAVRRSRASSLRLAASRCGMAVVTSDGARP